MSTINYLPILVAALVSFGISSLWYSPILFGKEWLALQKISEDNIRGIEGKKVWKSYLVQIIMSLFTFAVLAFIISLVTVRTSTDGAFLGILTWLGFIAPTSFSRIFWRKEPITLVLIDSINDLIALTIGGAIIGAWK